MAVQTQPKKKTAWLMILASSLIGVGVMTIVEAISEPPATVTKPSCPVCRPTQTETSTGEGHVPTSQNLQHGPRVDLCIP